MPVHFNCVKKKKNVFDYYNSTWRLKAIIIIVLRE